MKEFVNMLFDSFHELRVYFLVDSYSHIPCIVLYRIYIV